MTFNPDAFSMLLGAGLTVAAILTAEMVVLLFTGPLSARRMTGFPVVNALAPVEVTFFAVGTAIYMSLSLLYCCNPFVWLWVRRINACADADGVITMNAWRVRNVYVGLGGAHMERLPPKGFVPWGTGGKWAGHPLWRARRRALKAARAHAEARADKPDT